VYLARDVEIILLISLQIEREMGSGGFILTYAAAGIFGNVLGGNFALVGAPSVGASGAIFGTLAVSPSVVSVRAAPTFPVGHMGGLVCPLEISPQSRQKGALSVLSLQRVTFNSISFLFPSSLP
jgi:hypothetical protein